MRARRRLLALGALSLPAVWGCGGEGEPGRDSLGTIAQPVSTSHDPCGLLTRAEAEEVLGALVVEPYRSRRDTSVADPAGPTCTYQTEGGRVLLLTPEWTYGKMMLDTERLVGGLVRQVAELPGAVADTLEGPWDDVVVGMSGELVMRKGARSLTISHLESSTDVTRLAAVPEPVRPVISADGCPLLPDVVTTILELPVRLAPRPVRSMDACSYQLLDDPTVELDLAIQPAEVAPMVFEGLQARAKGMRGPDNPADSLALGDEGWAYGSSSGSEAAVRVGERLFHAKMAHPLSSSTPALRDAMVRLVAAMMAQSS
jgi:hypothetical protein